MYIWYAKTCKRSSGQHVCEMRGFFPCFTTFLTAVVTFLQHHLDHHLGNKTSSAATAAPAQPRSWLRRERRRGPPPPPRPEQKANSIPGTRREPPSAGS